MSSRIANKHSNILADPWGSPVHRHLLGVRAMDQDEFQKTCRHQIKSNANYSMRYFNSHDAYFQSTVMSQANKRVPGAFKTSEIGLPFECFTQKQRLLLIQAMNELSKLGKAMPPSFPTADQFINE
ncbi:hypothetical protein [Pantoea sp.]|uniref:hypothetical protein n=1 Tax=Pantoea sp. TaxID=69393 RepID=UPI0031CDD195